MNRSLERLRSMLLQEPQQPVNGETSPSLHHFNLMNFTCLLTFITQSTKNATVECQMEKRIKKKAKTVNRP